MSYLTADAGDAAAEFHAQGLRTFGVKAEDVKNIAEIEAGGSNFHFDFMGRGGAAVERLDLEIFGSAGSGEGEAPRGGMKRGGVFELRSEPLASAKSNFAERRMWGEKFESEGGKVGIGGKGVDVDGKWVQLRMLQDEGAHEAPGGGVGECFDRIGRRGRDGVLGDDSEAGRMIGEILEQLVNESERLSAAMAGGFGSGGGPRARGKKKSDAVDVILGGEACAGGDGNSLASEIADGGGEFHGAGEVVADDEPILGTRESVGSGSCLRDVFRCPPAEAVKLAGDGGAGGAARETEAFDAGDEGTGLVKYFDRSNFEIGGERVAFVVGGRGQEPATPDAVACGLQEFKAIEGDRQIRASKLGWQKREDGLQAAIE